MSDKKGEKNQNEQLKPDDESVRLRLQLAWQDHHHARDQSWKSLQLVTVVFAALVGIDLKFENDFVTVAAGIATMFLAVSGFAVTKHHRNGVQVREFNIINKLQKHLGLINKDFVWGDNDELKAPSPVDNRDIFSLKKNNAPLFLMRMYSVVCLLALLLVLHRVCT